MLLVAVALALLSAAPLATASPWVTLDDSHPEHDLTATLEIYDEAAPLGEPGDVIAATSRFHPLPSDERAFGYRDKPLWLRVSLANGTSERRDWILDFASTTIRDIRLYDEAGTLLATSGYALPIERRAYPSLRSALPLKFEPGATRTFYIRIFTRDKFTADVRAYTAGSFSTIEYRSLLASGVYYGSALALVLYNLFLFFSIRDRIYLLYVAFVTGVSTMVLTLDGTADVVFRSDRFLWVDYADPIAMVGMLAAVAFTRAFLRTAELLPRYDVFLRGLFVTSLVVGAMRFLGNAVATGFATDTVVALGACSLFFAGVLTYRGGLRLARFFLFSWVWLVALLLMWLVTAHGLLPSNFITLHGVHLGSGFEMVLMSFALADRIKILSLERERADRQALENKALIRSVEFFAHDIRKPYTMINAIFKTLRSTTEPDALQRSIHRYVGEVGLAQASADQMINDLLSLGGDVRIDAVESDLSGLVQEAHFTVFAPRPSARVTFEHVFEHRSRLLVDRMKIGRVLANILENATQALGDRGRLWIRSRDCRHSDGPAIEVVIGNDGPAIPPEVLPHVFDRFVTHGKPGGTGLGLAISRKIVMAHGGQLTVRSGQGATEFLLILPATNGRTHPETTAHLPTASADVQSRSLAHVASDRRLPSAAVPRVVVVDDDVFVREAWQRELEHVGVLTFDGPPAFWRFHASDPSQLNGLSCVVTDLHFGGDASLTGVEFAAQIKAVMAVPVLLSTESSGPDVVVTAGVDLVIPKEACSWPELERYVQSLNKPRA